MGIGGCSQILPRNDSGELNYAYKTYYPKLQKI